MSAWQLFKQIISSTGVYKRTLFFWLAIGALGLTAFYLVLHQAGIASEVSGTGGPKNNSYSQIDYDIVILPQGKVTVNGKIAKNTLKPYKTHDQLRVIILDQPGRYFEKVKVRLTLPRPAGQISQIKPELYAIHGVESHQFTVLDTQTVTYELVGVSPASTVTIAAGLPKGLINWPFYRLILPEISQITFGLWFIAGLFLPLLTLIITLRGLWLQMHGQIKPLPGESITMPPSNLSPALVGILYSGKIALKEIAALILSLASRGVLTIHSKKDPMVDKINFSFGKRQPLESVQVQSQLQPYEQKLLTKLFSEKVTSSLRDVEERVTRHIFSAKIAEVYLLLYEAISQKGFFIENPGKVRSRYKNFGMFAFFIGVLGFSGAVWIFPDPKYVLLFWAGMIFSSFIISRLADYMPIRTLTGRQEMAMWLSFRNYLASPQSLSILEASQELFEKYLPYAMVLDVEVEWARRFSHLPFKLPDWYSSNSRISSIEDFASDVFGLVGYVSHILAASRAPKVA